MGDDIEHRLAAAAEAVREREVILLRCRELEARLDELARVVTQRRSEHAGERKDVERLEGMSLTRLVASLRGARDDKLARERAEAEAARYRLADAQARLRAAESEHAAAQARLAQLADAPAGYVTALDAWERHLRESGDPRGRQLGELAAERGRLVGELRELQEALAAAQRADAALSQVQDSLESASGWSTYDTFFGGGAIASSVKHSRLDEAARAAPYADQRLAVLRTELADVPGMPLTAPGVAVDGMTRFVDIWFDNIFTDFSVRGRIKDALDNVMRCRHLVGDVHERLRERTARTRARVRDIEAQRRAVLNTD